MKLAYLFLRWFDNRLIDLETQVSIWRDRCDRRLYGPRKASLEFSPFEAYTEVTDYTALS